MTFDPIEERDATIAELRTRLADPWDLEGNAAAIAWRKKAKSAEADRDRLREGLQALADEWDLTLWPPRLRYEVAAKHLRALLSRSPAATTGEAVWDVTAECPRCNQPNEPFDRSKDPWCPNEFHTADKENPS